MDFDNLVYQATYRIPIGSVTTYGYIAQIIGYPNHSRQVGKSLSRNPYFGVVPCHRVVKSNGEVGGFFGSLDNTSKIALLQSEGVVIKGNYVDKAYINKSFS